MSDEVNSAVERKGGWSRPRIGVRSVRGWFVFGGLAFITLNAKSEVEAELAAIRQRGFPVSPVELDAWYKKVPAESNAALAFQEAYSLHVEPGPDNPQEIGKELKVGEPLSDELRIAAENYLKDNAEVLKQIRAAAQLNEGRFPVDLTTGFSALLPHLAHMKRMSILMKWQVIHQSAEGHREEAVRALEDGFAMAAVLEEELRDISALVRIAMTAMMMPAMERLRRSRRWGR